MGRKIHTIYFRLPGQAPGSRSPLPIILPADSEAEAEDQVRALLPKDAVITLHEIRPAGEDDAKHPPGNSGASL